MLGLGEEGGEGWREEMTGYKFAFWRDQTARRDFSKEAERCLGIQTRMRLSQALAASRDN